MTGPPAEKGAGPVRAVVRYRLDPPPAPGQPPLTDALGTVVSNTDREIVIDTRRGRVVIPRALVVATRIVPPAPPRRGVVAGDVGPLELHRAVVHSWPPMERAALGDWVLRASRGFTARGNSVLPVGDPGLSPPEAVDAVAAWYADRGLPANFTIAGPVGFDPARDPLGAILVDRGYACTEPSLFLTAALDTVRAALGPSAPDETDADRSAGSGLISRTRPDLTEDWLRLFDGYRTTDREAARAILTGSPGQAFATAEVDGVAAGVGRLGMSGDWGGVAAMWVDPAYRRRGVAQAMLRELVLAAAELGATKLHLQAWAANAPALALYQRAGFRVHHAYVNATRP